MPKFGKIFGRLLSAKSSHVSGEIVPLHRGEILPPEGGEVLPPQRGEVIEERAEMSHQQDLDNFLNATANDLTGFIGASVVDLDTGMALASVSHFGDFDLEVAAAYNSEMIKAKFKAMEALGIGRGSLQDMLLTLEDQYHLINILDNNLFVYVAAFSSQTNLALMRNVVKSNLRKHYLQR